MFTRRNLQIVMFFLALVPVITGILAMMGISDPLYTQLGLNLPADPTFDSNLRFFGGVWCGLGIAALWLIKRIEQETALFRAIWGSIFLGGIGRLLSMLLVGAPLLPFIGFTALEIVGAPLIMLWQRKIAKNKNIPS